MKRRDFFKTSAVVAGLAGSLKALEPLSAQGSDAGNSGAAGSADADNRPPEFLKRVQADRFVPKPPTPGAYTLSPMPLAERVRRKLVPQRGICSVAPGELVRDTLISGNGAMKIELLGNPYAEQILFHHESLLMPWKRPMEAPNVADIFPQVRQMALDGKNREAVSLALEHLNATALKQDTEPHATIPAFLMQLDFSKTASAKNYLRTANFEDGELAVFWSDEQGDWTRKCFVSRPDNVVVQWLAAPQGHSFNVRIALRKSGEWSMSSGASWGNHAARSVSKGIDANEVRQEFSEQSLVYKSRLDPSIDNSGYAGVTRVVRNGGTARVDQDALVIENASSVMLLTRIEHYPDFSDDKVETLRQAVGQISPDYSALLERHHQVHAAMLNRVTVDFGGAAQYGMSVEELLSDQRSRPENSPALLESLFEMGRHWCILSTGKYPSIPSETPTLDLQTAGAAPGDLRPEEESRPAGIGLLQMAGVAQGNLRETSEAFFNWIESLASDCRANAKNLFGFRGASYPLWPQKEMGVKYFYSSNPAQAGLWPYWISAGGLVARPFWDHYLLTGDGDFLRNRVVPLYKDLALFYEDFLTVMDKNGNYVFVPSFSPDNNPTSTEQSGPTFINATMDIAVCREVLTHLIQACETLGSDTSSVAKWKTMLAKMPPYLVELDGTLKEWAWPTLQERYSHRHVSHLYGAWPGDEMDPDRSPRLARAAVIADRRRTFDLMSASVAGETLPAYARCHRALAGARLKDNVIAGIQLRQLLEQGYISASLRTSREPYAAPIPDAQTGIPAIIMEMLLYSRPGVIEVLPALPPSLASGTINGMLARTFAKIDKLSWDMKTRKVNLTITSLRKQDITLIARQGIEKITASAGVLSTSPHAGAADCELHLPEGTPVEIQLKLGSRNSLEWAAV